MPNEENLLKLAEYLEGDELKAGFHMQAFSEELPDCGTVCCALGHMQFLFDLSEHKEFFPRKPGEFEITWGTVCEEFCGFKTGSPEYHWLFGMQWQWYDNTAKGAARRIRMMLEKGVPQIFKSGPWPHFPEDSLVFKKWRESKNYGTFYE
jgi:hypothetical protein